MKLFGNSHRKGSSNHGDAGKAASVEEQSRELEKTQWDEQFEDESYEALEDLSDAELEALLKEELDEDSEDSEVLNAEDDAAAEDTEDDTDDEDDGDDHSDDDDDDDDDDDNRDDAGEDEETDDTAERPKKKRKITAKRVLIVGLSCLVVVLIGCGLFVNYLLGLINYQKANSDYFATVSDPAALAEEEAINEKYAAMDKAALDSALEADEEDLARWDQALKTVNEDAMYKVPVDEDVYNILLVGTDARDLSEAARSDTMILVSLNQKSKTIYLTSFLRDCYVSIPGYGNTRLGHAFAYGGPALLMETLENNFKVHVDRYMVVNFYSFMDIIDILDGVWIYVTEEEAEVTNDYIWSMNKLLEEEDPVADYLWSYGWYRLNGKQALAYARNRYVGNDYERTLRQRNIIEQVYNGAMESSPAVLVDLAVAILPQIVTDMTKSEVLGYAANALAYMDYEIVSQQIPAPGTYSGATISGMSVISLDMEDNIEFLQSTVYGDVSYGAGQTDEDQEEPEETPETADTPKPSPSAKAAASAKPKTSSAASASTEKTSSATASPNIAPPAASR